MAFYLGIDGGGSKTACAVGDEASALATAIAGGCNMVRVPLEPARASLHAAIEQACRQAGISPKQISVVVAGVAGASGASVVDNVRRAVGELVACQVHVVTDIAIALEAAFAGDAGVVVMAGTGSIAYGRNQAGQTARAGGWGPAISDEGSAHWIGRRAVSAALEDHESGDDELLSRILAAWKLSSPQELIKTANASPPPDFAGLFPVVVQDAPRRGSSQDILREAGEALAALAKNVIIRLWDVHETVSVAVGGGVFAHAPMVRSVFASTLRGKEEITVEKRIVEPVEGALWMARNKYRVPRTRYRVKKV